MEYDLIQTAAVLHGHGLLRIQGGGARHPIPRPYTRSPPTTAWRLARCSKLPGTPVQRIPIGSVWQRVTFAEVRKSSLSSRRTKLPIFPYYLVRRPTCAIS